MIEFLKGSITPKDWMANAGILGFTAFLCIVFAFFIRGPQQDRLASLEANIKKQQEDIAKAEEIKKNIDTLRNKAMKTQELVKLFEKRLPESREIPTLLQKFEGFAGEIPGLTVRMSQLPVLREEKKETIPYTVTAKGSFHQIVSFINRLERYERYLKISDLKIGEEKDGVAEATFSLSTFRFIQPNEGSQS